MKKIATWLKKAKKYKAYHGSSNKFNTFSYQYLGQQGTGGSGVGFYFTDNKKTAEAFANKYLYTTELQIKKPLSTTMRTINRNDISKLLKKAPNLNNALLDNWGDINREPLITVLNRALNAYNDINTDKQLINNIGYEIYNENWPLYFKTLRNLLGYDGLIDNKGPFKHLIAFNPDQIKITNIQKMPG